MLISIYLYAILKSYLIINIYQQSHYQFRFYLKHFLLNFIFYDVFPLLVFLIGNYQNYWLIHLICGIYLVLFGLFYLFARVKLKFTKRVWRLYLLLILYLPIGFIPYVGGYLLLFLEYSILPILLLERWISYCFNRPYIRRATAKMKEYHGKVIAITGSFGKTTTKLLFQQGIQLFYSCSATAKSYNTELGIAKFINQIPDLNVYDYLIFEFGASHQHDIEKLKKIAPPNIVVVTEIGLMHVETFGSLDAIIREKMSIVDGAELAILNYDCSYIRDYPMPKNIKVLSYGFNHGDYQAKIKEDESFDFYYQNQLISSFSHSFVGQHQVLNCLAALAFLDYLNVSFPILEKALYQFQGGKNRLELKKMNHRLVLDDSFNSNYQGFIEALNILRGHLGKRIVMTPGMVELGKYKKELFLNLVSYLVASSDIIILIGYYQTKLLYQQLRSYSKEVYLVRNFMEGYYLYLLLVKNEKDSMLLIENDLPDIYRVGLI